MSQKIETTLVDDLDGTDAAETILFGLDGLAFEIDLSAHNAYGLRGALGEFVHVARKIGRMGESTATKATNRVPPRADREQTQAIRDWGRRHGLEVKDRGRIPELVQLAFDKQDPSLALS